MSVVADASCFVALFLPDEDSSLVERYLDQAETVAAPKLAIVETAAAFFRRVRKGSFTVPQAKAAADSWQQTIVSGSIRFYEDAAILSEACTTAGRLSHALQDCIYLELARKLGYTLVTGDRVFGQKAASVYQKIAVL